MTADAGGNLLSSMRYTAFGETRYASGSTSTDYLYTGQREEAELGLYYYVARWYDPALGRFIQADTIVPNPGNPMDWDRYAYVRNNPVNYTDPSGHMVAPDTRENGCSGQGPACIMDIYYAESGDSEGLHDSVEAYVIRNPEYDPAQDPELTATGQFTVAAAKTRVGMQNGSFWDYVAFGTMVGFGTYTTGFAPAEPILGQNSKLSNRQRDIWGDPDCPGCGYNTGNINWTLGSGKSEQKWANQMTQRGWTSEQISEAIVHGARYPATNNANGNPATRYVHPVTRRSVVVDNVTHEVIMVGGDNFGY